MSSEAEKDHSLEILRQKFNHAWKYFELHANQRIVLFRFYIIFLTLFATGIVFLIIRFPSKSTLHEWSAIGLSVAFVIVTIVFWLLDARNRRLIKFSEEALIKLENEYFYKEQDNIKIFKREKKDCYNNCVIFRHTICFRIIYFLACVMAIGFIAFSAYSMSYYACHPEPLNDLNISNPIHAAVEMVPSKAQ